MELCAAVIGLYIGWTVLAMFPRRVVRPSYRLLQDPVVLVGMSMLLALVCCEPVSSLLVAYVAFVMYNDLPSPRMAVGKKAVFITGCDTGLGHKLALQLDGLGFTVYAGCLFKGGPGEQKLVTEASSRLTTVQLDVTDVTQVEEAARVVSHDLKGQGLHGVVNNAGILMSANMEVMAASDIRKIMEVNCMGCINMYRAFMPLLRCPRQRKDRARIVNVSSNMGLAPSGQNGPYVASKAAVMILSETWRSELRPMGIDVSTIIPSSFKTGILAYNKKAMAEKWWSLASEDVRNYFGRECFEPETKVKDADKFLTVDFTPLTNCMVEALLTKQPRPIYYKGLMARSLPFLYLHLPAPLWDLCMPALGNYLEFPVKALQQDANGNANNGHSAQMGKKVE